MRIVFALNSYLPESLGGTEMYTNALAKFLIHSGIEAFIVVPAVSKISSTCYEHEGVTVYRYAENSVSDKDLIVGDKQPSGIENFLNVINELKPDIVHFQMISVGSGITLFHLKRVKQLGYKTVLTMHLTHYTCLTNNLLQNNKSTCDGIIDIQKCTVCYLNNKKIPIILSKVIYFINEKTAQTSSNFINNLPLLSASLYVSKKIDTLKVLSENTDKIVVITKWYKDILLSNHVPEEKIILVKQGVIFSDNQTAKLPHLINTKLKLIFIGRVAEVKGIHLLIRALKQIDPLKYQLDIYGKIDKEDIYFKSWNKFVIDNKLSVSFKGSISQSEVIPVLRNYDFLCLPSLFSEMSPLVIQEAFEAGVPVIGSNVPGITEEIKNEFNGFIFPFGKWEKLQAIINEILKSPQKKQLLKQNITPPRNFNQIGKECLDIYFSLLN